MNAGVYDTSPVSSNIITANETVILDTPARKAADPTIAKMPGEISGVSCPISLPKKAPASSAGMIIPEGTLHPKVMIVKKSLTVVP